MCLWTLESSVRLGRPLWTQRPKVPPFLTPRSPACSTAHGPHLRGAHLSVPFPVLIPCFSPACMWGHLSLTPITPTHRWFSQDWEWPGGRFVILRCHPCWGHPVAGFPVSLFLSGCPTRTSRGGGRCSVRRSRPTPPRSLLALGWWELLQPLAWKSSRGLPLPRPSLN